LTARDHPKAIILPVIRPIRPIRPISIAQIPGWRKRQAVAIFPPCLRRLRPSLRPKRRRRKKPAPRELRDRGYLVICWNDPVNLMVYVTHVFQIVFGWPKARAERHMMQVHQAGKSLLARETFEKAEHYVHQLQGYGLHATMEREE